VWDSGYGQHDAGWLSFYRYLHDVCNLTQHTQPLTGMWEIAESAGWWLPHAQLCWVSERPIHLARDPQGRLHDGTRPAIEYPDGWGVYAWHGVRVPEHVIRRPLDLTAKEITDERNAEVRRVMLERYTPARYLLDLGAKPVHQDDTGELYKATLADDEALVLVKVTNSTPESDGTVKDYWLRVPPTMTRARDAVAWTFGMQAADYQPTRET
jgi:hypothetical protein